MRATIAWSVADLDHDAAQVLAVLSAFPGGARLLRPTTWLITY
ncbi:hypothetical protein BH24ACT12_BH24ACT12_01770 [soil metagenome]